MSNRPWMPLYVADYLADTGHLSTLEHGAYMLLIMHYWQNGGLPADDRRLARVCRMSSDEWGESREALSELFEDGWRHKRIDAELNRASDISSKRKAAAEQRHNKGNANASANAEQMHTQSQSHTPKEKEPPDGGSKKPTPRIELEAVLDTDHADAVLEHRQRMRKPLTARAAKLLAADLAKWHDPNAAADAMIKNGWQGFDPTWLENRTAPRGHSPPPKKTTQASMWRDEARKIGIIPNDSTDQHTGRLDEGHASGPDRMSGLARRIASA